MQRLIAPTEQNSLKKRIFWRSFLLLTLLIVGVSVTAIVSETSHYHQATKTFYSAQARLLASQIPDQVLWNDNRELLHRLKRTVSSDNAITYAYLTLNNVPLIHTFEQGFPEELLPLSTGETRNIDIRTIADHNDSEYYHIMVDVGTTEAILHFGILRSELNRRAWNNIEQIIVMTVLALLIGAGLSRQIAAVTTSEVEQSTKTLIRQRCFLQTVIDGIVDPVRVINDQKQIILLNRAAKNNLNDHYGDTCSDNYCHERNGQNACPLQSVRDSNGPIRFIQHLQQSDGNVNIYEIEASPLIDKGRFAGIVETTRDITDRLKLEASLDEKESRLLYMSHHDLLTSLPNRILFRDRLTQSLACNNLPSKVALLFIGLDRFKKINESLGREAGDQALSQIAMRLKDCFSNGEVLARLGGDEFAVIIEGVHKLTSVSRMAKQILAQFSSPLKLNDHEIYLTTSIGISLYPNDGNDPKQLMTNADVALTRAKEEGKDRYQFFEADMTRHTNKFFQLENDLRKALDKQQLVVYYQPQINLDSQKITGLEALVRWNHPQHGMISPLDFIPLAEECGLIVPIGEWVLRNACEQVVTWQQQGMTSITVAVNLSPLQFRQNNLVTTVSQIIEETGIDPSILELEITESMIMDGVDKATSTMLELTDLGLKLAIDDFGTGYSSLSYLRYFPLSKLKIDKCFIERVTCDEDDAALASSVIALAHSLNLKVVAEGIETEAQAAFLRQKNCHQGQGFLFSKPLPADQLIALLKDIQ
ncbi:MAG: EAL domain-containing protein [Desulfuromonas sp.]|nr:EAL domain-containing protein [Desulfuromonas sp.]